MTAFGKVVYMGEWERKKGNVTKKRKNLENRDCAKCENCDCGHITKGYNFTI